MIDLTQLQTLQAVGRTGSVSAAAETLHLTTSAVSQRLTKFEHDVGQTLLYRQGRSVRLTDAAELLIGFADRIMVIVNEAETALEEQRGSVAGRVSVAAFPTAARGLLPIAVSTILSQYPDLRVEVSEIEPDLCIPPVMRGEVDIAIMQDWFELPIELPPDLRRTVLLDDIVDIALPADHRLAGASRIDLDELLDEAWVTWPVRSGCHNWLLHTLRARGTEPNIAHTAAEYATQLALVAAGLGVAAAPRLGRDPAPVGVRIVELRPAPRRHVFAVWRPASAHRSTVRATIKALVKATQALTDGDNSIINVGSQPSVQI